CLRRPNGNTRLAESKVGFIRGETSGSTSSRIQARTSEGSPSRLGSFDAGRVHLEFWTWLAMSPNGLVMISNSIRDPPPNLSRAIKYIAAVHMPFQRLSF